MTTLSERIAENPFYVLELKPECSRQDVEREGQKLLSMLALGLASAKTYTTPLGTRPRTEELIRAAMAELREPSKRLVHELLARLPASLPAAPTTSAPKVKWESAPMAFGYGPRRKP